MIRTGYSKSSLYLKVLSTWHVKRNSIIIKQSDITKVYTLYVPQNICWVNSTGYINNKQLSELYKNIQGLFI